MAEPTNASASTENAPEPASSAPAEAPKVVSADSDKDAVAKQRAADLAWKTKNPNKPLVRAANPACGGEGGQVK